MTPPPVEMACYDEDYDAEREQSAGPKVIGWAVMAILFAYLAYKLVCYALVTP